MASNATFTNSPLKQLEAIQKKNMTITIILKSKTDSQCLPKSSIDTNHKLMELDWESIFNGL